MEGEGREEKKRKREKRKSETVRWEEQDGGEAEFDGRRAVQYSPSI